MARAKFIKNFYIENWNFYLKLVLTSQMAKFFEKNKKTLISALHTEM